MEWDGWASTTVGLDGEESVAHNDKVGMTPQKGGSRKEIMQFQMPFHIEHRWTTQWIFCAFDQRVNPHNINATDSWQGAVTGQIAATMQIVWNGPQIRNDLATIYDILCKDQYIITDVYNEETSQMVWYEFNDNQHDQSIWSISTKVCGFVLVSQQNWLWNDTMVPFPELKIRHMTKKEMHLYERREMEIFQEP